MVALPDSKKEKKMKSKGKSDKKRRLETPTENKDELVDAVPEDQPAAAQDDGAPVVKKPKINEAEEKITLELQECENLLAAEDKTLSDKAEALTKFLYSVVDNNVNTIILKEDFPGWLKTWIVVVADGTTKVSDEFLKFLGAALQAAPTAFEPILEKILSICFFYPRKKFTVEVYEDFMVRLVSVFERLRRFPKFIAKLLCCARENLFGNAEEQKGRKSKAVSVDSKFLIEQILTPKLREAMGLVVNLLPVGQVVDLWKTFHHNLDVECIQRLLKNSGDRNLHTFFAIVAELFEEFLSNAKVADYSVPTSTIEKVAELMISLRDECLKPLAAVVKGRNVASEVVKSFLKLAHAWVELTGVIVWYNPKCKLQLLSSSPALDDIEDCSATNFSIMHSYMNCNEWVSTCQGWLNRQESGLTFLIVKLVAQKLRMLVAHQQMQDTPITGPKEENKQAPGESDDEDESLGDNVTKLIQESADFIWTHQDVVNTLEMKDTLTLVADHVPSQRLMELASNLVKQIQINEEAVLDLQQAELKVENRIGKFENSRLHYALVLEALGEIMRRIGKMKLLSKFIKSTLNNTLSMENRARLLSIPFSTRSRSSKINNEFLQIAISLSTDVNKLIEEAMIPDQPVKKTEEFSGTLIDGMMAFVCSLDIENYPTEMKTIVFLCSVVILFALTEQTSNDCILSRTVNILTSSCSDAQGNEVLFGVRWIELFKWVEESGLFQRLDSRVQKLFCNAVLCNIYLSQKLVTEFEENELQEILSQEVSTNKLSRILHLIEFLIQESNDGKSNNKVTPIIKQHATQLTNLVSKWLTSSGIKILKKLKKTHQDINEVHCLILRTLELIGTAHQTLQIPVDETLISAIATGVDVAVSIVQPEKLSKLTGSASSLNIGTISQALKFLHTVSATKGGFGGNLEITLHRSLWEISCSTDLWRLHMEKQNDLIPKRFVKDLFELSSPEDFQTMCTTIPSMMKIIESADTNRFMIFYLMEEMLDAELAAEKKPWRRNTVEEYVHSMLNSLLSWNSSETSIVKSVIPYIQFQTKLVRRRNAMISLKSLAVSLASVTSVPLDQIEKIPVYRKVFSVTADLMNALVMHRADALSSRTHVYLQCFQYLIDNLAKKADQRNKLSDEDIYDLRHCAHSIERMCQSIKTGQKEFARISPYFVAVIMKQFEMHTVYPSVKNSLQNGVYKLLDMCDDNGVAQLNAMLTIGSREIFRTTYDLYKKYYKYKGKV